MKADFVNFGLRLPPTIKAQLDAAASMNGRSIHGEILFRLQESFTPSSSALAMYSDGDLVRELMRRYKRGEIEIKIAGSDPL